jgi:uncharacterized membrane protein YoaK (UPF0700 family)
VVLVIIAGFLDAVGFLALAGSFVAFMSGNTSAGGAFAGTLDISLAFRQLFPLPLFVAGIYIGALVVQAALPESQHRRYAMVLLAEWGLIAFVLAAATMEGLRSAVPLDPPGRFFGLAAPLAVAMGLQNAMRMEVKGATLATTYVTGTLHVAAQALARATLLAVAARRARREAPVASSGRAGLRMARAPRGETAALRAEARGAAELGPPRSWCGPVSSWVQWPAERCLGAPGWPPCSCRSCSCWCWIRCGTRVLEVSGEGSL